MRSQILFLMQLAFVSLVAADVVRKFRDELTQSWIVPGKVGDFVETRNDSTSSSASGF